LCMTATNGRRCFPVRASTCCRAPASVATVAVFCHLWCATFRSNRRQCRVIVGIVAILVDFLTTLFLVVFPLLALPPPPDAETKENCNEYDRYDHGDGGLSAGRQALVAAAAVAAIATTVRKGGRRRRGCRGGRSACGCRDGYVGCGRWTTLRYDHSDRVRICDAIADRRLCDYTGDDICRRRNG
jgi:hypothetical protein